eukprot:CAMPEP_0114655998 /NCGR_PEP_ID=MMETSP0191-20121206/11702_1 /TAXON_ID=126664 /ORGANISM="Sorites sp." /LENGTH=330 /DNA_ID=CAMNT_0001872369 /DNA_START=3143 /DNA_END=4135 /DNA_ORIENTATION=+
MKGSINLDNITSNDIITSDKTPKNNEYKWGFMIIQKKRKWIFAVQTKKDMDLWMNNIKDVVNDEYFKKKAKKSELERKKVELKQNNKYGRSLKDKYKQRRQNNNNNNNGYNGMYGNNGYSNGNDYGNDTAWGNDDNNGYDGGMMTDEQKMEQIQSRTNKALDNALKSTIETEEIAFDTAVVLDGQRQQLQKIDKDLHEIEQDLDQTNDTLKGMKSLKGAFLKKFRKPVKRKDYKSPVTNNKSVVMRNDDNQNAGKIVVNKSQKQINKGPVNDEDQKLDDILAGIKRIKAVTEDINQELDEQNPILDSIGNRMDVVQDKMAYQTKTMNSIK